MKNPARFSLYPLALAVCSAVLAPLAASGEVVVYAETPGARKSDNYRMTVDGKPVLVERFGDVSYARFAFSGTASVVVEAVQPIGSFLISPRADRIAGQKDGTRLSFAVSKPRGLVVNVDALEKLLILADPLESSAPLPGGPGVKSLADYLDAGRDPQAPVTAAFQKAIDDTAGQNEGAGGTLYVSHGLYVAGQLKLKSNVHLYLASGALVRAVADTGPENFPPQAWKNDSSFIFIGKAKNVRITGRGIIDGNGREIRTLNEESKFKLLRTAESSQILIEGIILRDSARWTAHFLYSDDVTVRNLKIVNDLQGESRGGDKLEPFVSNTDGIDIDACQNALVEDSFIYTTDDAFSTKVTGYMGLKKSCTDVVMRNNVLWSLKCALRVGDETQDDMTNILFENNETIRADRLLGVWNGEGNRISGVRVVNSRAEYIGGDANERIFYFRIRPKNPKLKPGIVEDILVKDVSVDNPARQASTIEGFDEQHKISNVLFENLRIGDRVVKQADDIPLKFTNPFHSQVEFRAQSPRPQPSE